MAERIATYRLLRWLSGSLLGFALLVSLQGAARAEAEPPTAPGESAPEAERDEAHDHDAVAPEGSAPPGAEAEPKKPEPIVALEASRALSIEARSLRLVRPAAERLLRIAERYHQKTGQRLVVTGGDRTPKRQARVMLDKLESGEDLVKLYARKDLVREILAARERAVRERLGRDAILRRMAEVIARQVEAGQFISHHLAFRAADVRSRGLTPAQEAALRAVARAEGITVVDERESVAPCFHLGL
jgi:hypothetical protein